MHSTELFVGVTRVSNGCYVVVEAEYVGKSSVVHLVLHTPLLSQAYALVYSGEDRSCEQNTKVGM